MEKRIDKVLTATAMIMTGILAVASMKWGMLWPVFGCMFVLTDKLVSEGKEKEHGTEN